MALIAASNPKLQILDTLSKFSHDPDQEVCANAILSMGIVGAGEFIFVQFLRSFYPLFVWNLY